MITDDAGRASATVQFGIVAGAGELHVSVAALGESITIPYTTLPGALHHLVVDPRDTAIYVGASYPFRVHAGDQFGNERADGVKLHVLTSSVIALSPGRLVALDIGRGRIVMESGTVTDTAFVTVPPRGRLITFGWAPDFSALTQLTLVNTDGSERRVILRTAGNNGSASPIWTSTGDRIVFEGPIPPGVSGSLNITDTLGESRPLIDSAAFGQSIQAAVAAQAGLLYFFSANNSIGSAGIYRANADGTGATFLFPGVQPAPSPDGSRVAFIVPGGGGVLMVRELGTGQVRTVASGAIRPRWSPAGDWLAFVGPGQGSVQVVRADGTGLRTFASGNVDSHVSWSPDAAWLVISGASGGLKVIRVADGLVLPIAGTSTLLEAAWRP